MTNRDAESKEDLTSHCSRFPLHFRDKGLERDYLQAEYTRYRYWTMGSIVLGLALTLLYYPLDSSFLSSDVLDATRTMRFGVQALLTLLGVVGVLTTRRASVAVPSIFACAVAYGLTWAYIRAIAGPGSEDYTTFGAAQTILFVYACLGLPFRWAAAAALLIILPVIALAVIDRPAPPTPWHTPALLISFALIAGYGAFRHEWASRERFLAQRLFAAEYARRLAAEHDRSQWLGVIAGFTRHELRNAMAGISSSLELLERFGMPQPGPEYVGRAKRSLQLMRTVLQQVSSATSMEDALKLQEMEPVDLSRLVGGRIEDYRREHDGALQFSAELAEDALVLGNPDSLVQMLDKLLNNAVEHSEPNGTIRIGLRATTKTVRLEVEDHGDVLPEDVPSLFRPFVSVRRPGQEGSLGLGLYVTDVIARHHGGTVRVKPTRDRPGARFIVELPRLLT